jgi:nucleoside-diphosphate-sugar epimerase
VVKGGSGMTKKSATGKRPGKTPAAGKPKRQGAAGRPAKEAKPDRLALVNGAGGFLGYNVVRELVRQGWKVRATDLPKVKLDHLKNELGVETVGADLLDLDQCRALLKGVTHVFNVVGLFHFAATREQLYNANVTATEVMCRASSEVPLQRFVHVATIGVYGTLGPDPVDENWPHRPKNAYEETKEQGEAVAFDYCRTKGLPVVSLRPTVIYGPRSRYGLVTFMSTFAMMRYFGVKEAFRIPGGPKLSNVHVEDVARALVHIAEHGKVGEAYNCADDTPLAWGDMASFIADEFGIPASREISIPVPLLHLLGRVVDYVPDEWLAGPRKRIDKGWSLLLKAGIKDYLKPSLDLDFLGYLRSNHILNTNKLKATGFRFNYPRTYEGLRQAIEWYRENGWLPRLDQFFEQREKSAA